MFKSNKGRENVNVMESNLFKSNIILCVLGYWSFIGSRGSWNYRTPPKNTTQNTGSWHLVPGAGRLLSCDPHTVQWRSDPHNM